MTFKFQFKFFTFFVMLTILASFGATIYNGWIYVSEPEETVVGTVTQAYVKQEDKTSYYMIAIKKENGVVEVFQNTDDYIAKHKLNSSDIFAQAQVGAKVQVRVYGVRDHALALYRNILSLVVLETPPTHNDTQQPTQQQINIDGTGHEIKIEQHIHKD